MGPDGLTPPRLRIVVVAADAKDARFAKRVLEDHGDTVEIAERVTDALSMLARAPVDLAFVSLSLPRGDGLALVHHIRALYASVDVIVMSAPSELEESAHAVALGVLQVVVLPLTGDALLVAADRARERRLLVAERTRLAQEGASQAKRTATYARCAAFVSETDPIVVARRVLDACAGELAVHAAAIYLPLSLLGERLDRAAIVGDSDSLPAAFDGDDLDDVDPTRVVRRNGDQIDVVLLGDAELVGLVRLIPDGEVPAEDSLAGLEVVGALGAAALGAARKVEAIARAGIKDPDTSAYTFAYFGDAAGREIDRAARHGRRFALLTIGLEALDTLHATLPSERRVELRRIVSDAVLQAVRDSDVVARVEDDEYYVLLPETGLLGALAARRRILQRLSALSELASLDPNRSLDPIVGIAVYPSDGADLGRLLRTARRRSELARRGVHRTMHLAGLPFWECVDRLLGPPGEIAVLPEGRLALGPSLEATHDPSSLARHLLTTPDSLVRIGRDLVGDAVQHRLAGNVYVAGESRLGNAVREALEGHEGSSIRAWSLCVEGASRSAIDLVVDDGRVALHPMLLSLTELGGYALVARRLGPNRLLAYHSADLDLVDGLVTALQNAYHLQPGVA